MEEDVLRKPGAVLLAAPVLLGGFVESLVQRSRVARALGVVAIVAAGTALVAVAVPPAPSAALLGSTPAPVSADLFMPIGTAHDAADPFVIEFDQPMDPASVAGALQVQPAAAYALAWDDAGRTLTIRPTRHWATGTLYRVEVDTTARSAGGSALHAPLRSVVLTGGGGTVELAPTMATPSAARLDTAFRIRLDRPASLEAVRAALHTDPPLAGEVVPGIGNTYLFRPAEPLAAGATYRLWLLGLQDVDGVPFQASGRLEVRTVEAPKVVSIAPKDRAGKVRRDAAVRLGFSLSMDRPTVEAALRVRADGKPVAGRIAWSADGSTLTFTPRRALPYGAKLVVTLGPTARSMAGAAVDGQVAARATVRARPARAAGAATVGIPTGASGAVSGAWQSVERYYLRLMNCTRTGGWVTSTGACSSPGGRNVAPLALSAGISSRVSRPYARLLATRNLCSHFIGGNPGDRLRAAGYGSYNWAENLGCRSGNPNAAVLGSHLFFQSEKPYNGGHYRNLMNAAFSQAGIGVWVSGGRVRLVIDFYAS